jgi:hypothetical protein
MDYREDTLLGVEGDFARAHQLSIESYIHFFQAEIESELVVPPEAATNKINALFIIFEHMADFSQ